jgi:tetratricopeptide (TPR) repeat protein
VGYTGEIDCLTIGHKSKEESWNNLVYYEGVLQTLRDPTNPSGKPVRAELATELDVCERRALILPNEIIGFQMQLQLDPTKWMVSFVGFVADWVISREWSRVGVASIPMFFLMFVISLVFMGSRLDSRLLASKYLELGDSEIADWEASWTGARANKDAKVKPNKPIAPQDPESAETKKELSRFAEVLFKRVQILEPNNRSQFIIALTMAQRGAIGKANRMLHKIAPDDRPGYGPAHAWIAESLLREFQQKNLALTAESFRLVKHHLDEAMKWDHVPESLLAFGSEFMWAVGDKEKALRMLERAAEINPAMHLMAAKRSFIVVDEAKRMQVDPPPIATRIYEYAAPKAIEHFEQRVSQEKSDAHLRISLAEAYAVNERLDDAEKTLVEGKQFKDSPKYSFALSEIYRQRFRKSVQLVGDKSTGDMQLLEVAFRTDPSNPLVVEEIARLARINGPTPGNELISALQDFLAQGKATAVTHALLADVYLLRKNYAPSIPHLEQVVTRLPNSAQYMNNLAFVLVEVDPKRLDEALMLAQQAVQITPRAADYHDTLAKVQIAMGRTKEAISSLETAIELQPYRIDFHTTIAQQYLLVGNEDMAKQHRRRIELIKTEIAAAEAKAKIDSAGKSSRAQLELPPADAKPSDNGSITSEEPSPAPDTISPASESTAKPDQ